MLFSIYSLRSLASYLQFWISIFGDWILKLSANFIEKYKFENGKYKFTVWGTITGAGIE